MLNLPKIVLGVALCLGVVYRDVAAQTAPELVTDRPDQTESSVVVPKGFVQVETGVTYTDSGNDSRTIALPETLVRVGVHERLELRLGTSGWIREFEGEESNGVGDGEIGLKLYLWPERGWRPETALLASVSVPVGEDEYSSHRFDPAFRFNFSHTLSDRISLAYNLGMAWETAEEFHESLATRFYNEAVEQTAGRAVAAVGGGNALVNALHDPISEWIAEPFLWAPRRDRDTMATFQYTATLGFALTERWGMFAEVFGDVPANAPGGPAHQFDAGFTYLFRENIQWDIAGGFGLNGAADDWFVGTGISIRLHGPNSHR